MAMVKGLLLLLGAMVAVIGLMVPDGVAEVRTVALASCLLNASILGTLLTIETRFLVYKFYVFFIGIQPMFFLFLVLFYPVMTETMCSNTSLFSGSAHTLYYSFCLTPLLALALGAVIGTLSPEGRRQKSLTFYVDQAGNRLNYLLFLGGVSNLAIWFTAGLPNIIGYGFRILKALFEMAPMLLGVRAFKSKPLLLLWLGVFALGLFFAFLTGSRGYAFFPILYFVIGLILGLRGKRRLLVLSGIVVTVPLGLLMFGFIEHFRDEFGRKSIAQIDIGEVVGYIPKAFKDSLARGDEGNVVIEETVTYSAFRRAVDWTLVFAPNMSPGDVPFRGYGDFLQEIKSLAAFGGAYLDNSSRGFYPSVLFARSYGFNVYMGTTGEGTLKSFTVPFGVLADAWSRFGIISMILQTLILFAWFIAFEELNRRLFRRFVEVRCFGVFLLCGIALNFSTVYVLTRTIRRTIVYYIAGAIVFMAFYILRKRFFPRLFPEKDGPVPSSNAPMSHYSKGRFAR